MNKLDREARARNLHLLCQGQSIRAVTRLTGASKNTVIKLLVDVGQACATYQDRVLRNLPCKRVKLDEIWSFVYAKEKTTKSMGDKARQDEGDVWTWTAICADTKLLCTFMVGDRTTNTAIDFVDDLKERLANRVQLTTDGHGAYLRAVDRVFGRDVDYGMIVKIYGSVRNEGRYSPGECISAPRGRITGNPDEKHTSTSYAERQNLTMRMDMRRFTRLTNAFSKKVENHACAVALHAMHYNFVRIHQNLRVTPAMAAGVTDRLWEMTDVVDVLEASRRAQLRRSDG